MYAAAIFHWGPDAEEREAAARIRMTVFVEEQGVPLEEELDDTDRTALHVIVRDAAGEPVATARLYAEDDRTGRIGRMAVLRDHRGKGAGSAAMKLMIKAAADIGWQRLILDAQDQAIPFYERHGFKVCGPPHLDCGIPHHLMELSAEQLELRALRQP